jgi:hypothetical protein
VATSLAVRRLVGGAAALALVGAGAVGGYTVARVTEDDGQAISDSERERLADICAAQPAEDVGLCVAFVEDVVRYFEDIDGCGYEAALHVVSQDLRFPGSGQPRVDEWYDEALDTCD